MGEESESVFGIQCTVCSWRAVANERSRTEVSRHAIEHHLETGHLPIERFELYAHSLTER